MSAHCLVDLGDPDHEAVGEFVEPQLVKKWIDEGACMVVDCREPSGAEALAKCGHVVPGAISVRVGDFMFPKKSFEAKAASLKANARKHIVCYSDAGEQHGRCGLVCSALVDQNGLEGDRLHRMRGGLVAWKASGLQVVGPDSEAWKAENDAMVAPCAQAALEAPAIPGPDSCAGSKAVGRGVRVVGLKAGMRHLNSQQGTVLSWDAGGGRYLLRLRSSGTQTSLRAENLALMPERN